MSGWRPGNVHSLGLGFSPGDHLVAHFLDEHTVPQLRTLARGLGWALRGQKRTEIVEQLRRHYGSPESAAAALDQLGEQDRRCLSLLAWLGPCDVDELGEYVDDLQVVLPDGWLSGQPGAALSTAALDSCLARLSEGGYLIGKNAPYLPSIVGVTSAFANALPPIPELAPALPNSTDLEVRPARDLVHDLLMTFAAIADLAPIAVNPDWDRRLLTGRYRRWPPETEVDAGSFSRSGHGAELIQPVASLVPPETAEVIGRAANQHDPDATAFLTSILVGFGALVLEDDGGWLLPDADALAEMLAPGSGQLIQDSIAAWLQMPYGLWDEPSWLQEAGANWRVLRHGSTWTFGPDDFGDELSRIRTDLLQKVILWPGTPAESSGDWVDVAVTSDILYAVLRSKLAPSPVDSHWFLTSLDGSEPLQRENPADWLSGPDTILRYMLSGPLRWLGIVDTAHASGGTVSAARLTSIGHAVAERLPVEAELGKHVRWLDHESVEIEPSFASYPAVAALDRYAEIAEIGLGRITYRFSERSLAGKFAASELPSDIHAALESAGVSPSPDLLQLVEQWWGSWGRIRTYKGLALIELADEILVEELLATTDLSSQIIYECSPTSFLIEPGPAHRLLKDLREAGRKPRVVKD